MAGELVLVTGGSGFVGAHCIVQLLKAGYRVRTTVRSLAREADVRAMVARGGVEAGAPLAVITADLAADAGWPEAVAGCDYVLHVASPFPLRMPKRAEELIVPARDGALRVLRAARDAGVKRVVLTSSFVAVGYGYPPTEQPFTETSWTNLDSDVTPYAQSKTLAERAAWDFIAREGGALQLAVINPVGVFGPALGPDLSASVEIVQRLMNGSLPALPRMVIGVVDVRDVADLHLRAMTHPAANGERFIAVGDGDLTLQQAAQVLKQRLGSAAARVPTRRMPDWILRVVALAVPLVRPLVAELGQARHASNAKARRVLNWSPRSNEDSIVATAESLVQLGLLQR